jgi:putative CocE/NonD family hydrolase
VRIFVMGANEWRDETEWPLARAVPTRLYLRANGALSREAPADEEPDEFSYDPRDPVPTVGGSTYLPGSGFFSGPRDRRTIEQRPDVLVYTSDPLQDDLEVIGPVKATLTVSTSAPDTDFTVALVDVHPDGRAMGVIDGILRLRYRQGLDRQVLAQPGQIYEIDVDLVATANVFRAGHLIRVEVSSSNFPRFDRNPNNGGVIAEATVMDLATARQRVFHDRRRASFITLPTVRGRLLQAVADPRICP